MLIFNCLENILKTMSIDKLSSPTNNEMKSWVSIDDIDNSQSNIELSQKLTKVNNVLGIINLPENREEIFREWMTNQKIRTVLKQILNDTPVLTLAHHNSIMTKLPYESTRTFWHQDRRYWHFENDDLVSVWLSLGDEFLENGLLEFIPGSHKIKFDKACFDEADNFLDENKNNKKLIEKKTHQNLSIGDVVLFHCKTLHHANKNSTDNTKISFVYTVRSQSNKPLKNTRSDFKEVILD